MAEISSLVQSCLTPVALTARRMISLASVARWAARKLGSSTGGGGAGATAMASATDDMHARDTSGIDRLLICEEKTFLSRAARRRPRVTTFLATAIVLVLVLMIIVFLESTP